jgi:protein-L-isoaspartate(D-aspartate) O-methyltransferase
MFEEERLRMVDTLRANDCLHDGRVAEAMMRVQRHLFVPQRLWPLAYADRPLPIDEGQTISAPHMVAMMAEFMRLAPGMKVLEVGAGSGYHAAVIAELVRPGRVFSIEVVPRLAETARGNLHRSGYSEVEVVVGDGSLGLPAEAPFDRISVAAAAPRIPMPLKEQLGEGGVMLIPVGGRGSQDLLMVRRERGRLTETEMCGVMFVPMVGEHGHRR